LDRRVVAAVLVLTAATALLLAIVAATPLSPSSSSNDSSTATITTSSASESSTQLATSTTTTPLTESSTVSSTLQTTSTTETQSSTSTASTTSTRSSQSSTTLGSSQSTSTVTISTTITATTSTSTTTTTASSATTSSLNQSAVCTQPDQQVADPGAPHGLFVLSPATKPSQPYYSGVKSLVTNPDVCGADFFVPWADVDNGPGTNPRYNWTSVDDEIQPWIQAGKEVNLIFWAVSYPGGGPSSTPSYVLSQVDTLQCGTSAVTPVFWEQPFITNYQAFMNATIQKYGANPSIGYFRFGLGTGGETFITDGFSAPSCQTQLQKYGYSLQVWENYIFQMLDYEKSLSSHVQLMVSLNQLSTPSTDYSLPDAVAGRAVKDGIGIGNQGLQQGDVSEYQSTQTCGADWCGLFNTYQAKVPLELQTVFASDPDGSGTTGSLVSLMPFGLQRHAQILEIYFVDWLTAYDPQYTNYTAYHTAYAAAFNSTAESLGLSQSKGAQQRGTPDQPLSGVENGFTIAGSALGCGLPAIIAHPRLEKLARTRVGERD